MGVYIKGMEKPKKCGKCPIMRYSYETGTVWCNALHLNVAIIPYEKRLLDSALNEIEPHEDCPLIEVTKPHGRFGDLDYAKELLAEYAEEYSEIDENGLHSEKWCGYMECINAIKGISSVIEKES